MLEKARYQTLFSRALNIFLSIRR